MPAIDGVGVCRNAAARLEFYVGIGDGNGNGFGMDIHADIFDARSCGSRVHQVNSVAAIAERSVEPQPYGAGLRVSGS